MVTSEHFLPKMPSCQDDCGKKCSKADPRSRNTGRSAQTLSIWTAANRERAREGRWRGWVAAARRDATAPQWVAAAGRRDATTS